MLFLENKMLVSLTILSLDNYFFIARTSVWLPTSTKNISVVAHQYLL